MPDRSSILDLPYLLPAQAQKHVTHNEALRQLDVLVQLRVKGTDVNDPPALPIEGDVYAVGDNASAAWAGHDNTLAAFLDGTWFFTTPREGWRAWDSESAALRVWNGSAWATITANGAVDSLPRLGINTSADATNRLSVASEATLLTNAGAGHQLKLNKATATDTASLLYQTGFSGHAEMGLNGSNDFSLKVSADGAAWTEAVLIDGNTGHLVGAAIQSNPLDRTAGKILSVGAFGMGNQAIRYAATHDLDEVRLLCGMIGNAGVSNVPVNAPRAAGAFAGFCTSITSVRGTQFLIETTGTQDAYFRADNDGWSSWKRVVTNANIVGTVTNDANGPSGAVIERGSNGDGEYVRFADGTQIATNSNAPIVSSPAPFVGTITRIDGDKLWIGQWF